MAFRIFKLLLVLMASNSALGIGLQCPEGSIPVTERGFVFNGVNYQGQEDIHIANKQEVTLCFKVQKRADYLLMPYNYEPVSNLRPVFTGNLDLRQLPIARSLKGYFEKEIVLVKATALRIDEKICVDLPSACKKDLVFSIFMRGEQGPTPIETTCPEGFFPPFFNNLTQQYLEGYYGYRQVPLTPGKPKKFCHFVSQKTTRFEMYVADRTGPAQCGYHVVTFSPPPNSFVRPLKTTRPAINTPGRFFNADGTLLPQGIWTLEVTASGQIPTCNNLMEINAH